jgi:hypothetical protein
MGSLRARRLLVLLVPTVGLVVPGLCAPGCGKSGSGQPPHLDGTKLTDGATHTDAGPVTDAGPLPDVGPIPDGGPTGTSTWGGVPFPWPLFDSTVPDVPPAVSPAHTFYVDAAHGNDGWDGTSITYQVGSSTGPMKTLGAALANPALAAGDTILLAGGIYRERPSFGGTSGQPGKPITIGSYGHGTGAPILDGGVQPGAWSHYSGQGQTTVWQTSTAGLSPISATEPVLGIYVHGGSTEAALREVAHGQIAAYGSDPIPTGQTQANIQDNSSDWYFDAAGQVLYADFGGTLGSGDPNSADISLLYNSENGPNGHDIIVFLPQGGDYFRFVGLTLRASSWTAVYSEASNNVFDHCDIKFNGGGGIAFGISSNDNGVTGNQVLHSRIWMNVLHNWPRFNNGNVTGGWPGALSWYSQSHALAQGDVIYQNGGEGLILWGTDWNGTTAHVSVGNELRQNVVYDNFSVNVYLDNTQGARVEQVYAFTHPRDPGQTFANLLTQSPGYDTDWGKRLTPAGISLGDEPGSSYDGAAHSDAITVINSIFAGSKFGFVDYDDGTTGTFHGLRDSLIANDTWVLGMGQVPGESSFGWRHLDGGGNPDNSVNSSFENVLIAVPEAADFFVDTEMAGAGPGITCDYNLYSGPGSWSSVGTTQDFTAWKSAHPWDGHSQNADAQLANPAEFSQTAVQKPVYDWSKAALGGSSPAIGAGVDESSQFGVDFTGAPRPAGAFDEGALNH